MNQFDYTKHDDKTPFFKVAYSCKDFQYVIFASDKIIAKMISKIDIANRDLLMDSTFKVVPYGAFRQLLIIYVSFLDTVGLMNFILMNLV